MQEGRRRRERLRDRQVSARWPTATASQRSGENGSGMSSWACPSDSALCVQLSPTAHNTQDEPKSANYDADTNVTSHVLL